MVRRLCVLLVASVLVVALLVPSVAFGDPNQPVTVAATFQNLYGYTDESITVGRLAADLGLSERDTLALCAGVDTWTIGSGAQRFAASELANVSAAAHQYMVNQGTWDSFSARVSGSLEIGAGLLLDLEPFWDALGFASLAENASFGDYTSGGVLYSSGMAAGWVPAYTVGSLFPAAPSNFTTAQAGLFARVMLDVGAPMKLAKWELDSFANYCRVNTTSTSVYMFCAVCQYTGFASGFFAGWPSAGGAPYVGSGVNSFLDHVLAHNLPSEAAVVVQALANSGLPGYVALAGSALANPGGVSLAALDAWGIPPYLPPGAVHDKLDFAGSWGDGLSGAADELASKVASLPLGFDAIGKGISSLMAWFGAFWDNVQSVVYAWVVPNPDWMQLEVPRVVGEMSDDLEGRAPFVVIGLVKTARDQFRAAGGSP